MKNIPITLYLTINATANARQLAAKYGLNPVSIQELYKSLNAILTKYPEEAYKDFAMIHPDRTMILDSVEQETPTQITTTESTPVATKETVSNADGGTGYKCGEKKSGADGTVDNGSTGFQFDFKKNLPFIAVTAVFLTGLVIVAKTL